MNHLKFFKIISTLVNPFYFIDCSNQKESISFHSISSGTFIGSVNLPTGKTYRSCAERCKTAFPAYKHYGMRILLADDKKKCHCFIDPKDVVLGSAEGADVCGECGNSRNDC